MLGEDSLWHQCGWTKAKKGSRLSSEPQRASTIIAVRTSDKAARLSASCIAMAATSADTEDQGLMSGIFVQLAMEDRPEYIHRGSSQWRLGLG